MNDKHWTTEQPDRPEPWEQSFYQTGSTCPPKSHGGFIAFLLVVLIILSSITSALGLLNIHLFQQLRDQSGNSSASVRFSEHTHSNSDDSGQNALEPTDANVTLNMVETSGAGKLSLGVCGRTVSSFDQRIYRLPEGIYITEVDETSDAAAKGLLPGDVLLQLNGNRVADTDTLKTLLHNYQSGDTVTLTVYRAGKQHTLCVTVGETK